MKSISTVGGLTMVSRVLGFTRDILLARFIGASLVADCFFVAFKLPNFFRRLFAEGAFNAAFVPIFCGILGPGKGGSDKEHRARARYFAEEALAVLLPVLLLFTALMQMAMPWAMYALAPGFADTPDKFALAIELTRATFPYLMLVSMVSLMAGVLNGLGRFAAAAAAPILLNITLIGSLTLFHDSELVAGRALAHAVTIAGIVQFIWIALAAHRAGMGLRLRLPRLSPRIRELGRVMLPAALGAGVIQVNLVIDIILASFLPQGSLSYLFFADRLNQLPIGVIGVAVGTVLLPALSLSLANGDQEKAVGQQNRAMEAALFLTIPAALALALIPGQLVGALFERGAFTSEATALTAMALSAYALGLPAYVLVKVLTPAFFSRKDTRTPVKVALVALATNLVLNIILMIPLKHVGLALATAISAWVNVIILYVILVRRGHFRVDARLKSRLLRIALASALMGAGVWFLADYMGGQFTAGTIDRIIAILALVMSGLVIYGVAARLFGAVSAGEIRTILKPGS